MKFVISVFKIERREAVLNISAKNESEAREKAFAAINNGAVDWEEGRVLDDGLAEVLKV